MNRSGWKRRAQSSAAEGDFVDRRILSEHRDNDFAVLTKILHGRRHMRSSFCELDRCLWSDIVDCKVVTATKDAVRHSFSHSTEANKTDSHDRSLFESAGARLFTANYRPVLVAVVMRDRRQQSITKRVSAGERYARHFRSSHDEAKILETQQCCESDLVVGFIDHDLAVDFVSRRSEEARS